MKTEALNNYFKFGVGALASYKLFDVGLARFLGMETLCHGTGPLNYLRINLNGGDPFFDGSPSGSTAPVAPRPRRNVQPNPPPTSRDLGSLMNSVSNGLALLLNLVQKAEAEKYFYTFKDSEILENPAIYQINKGSYNQNAHSLSKLKRLFINCMVYNKYTFYLGTLWLPRYHALLSGIATSRVLSKKLNIHTPINDMLGALFGLCAPTLRFRVAPERALTQVKEGSAQSPFLIDDPDYMGMAYKTKSKLPPSHLGITGSLMNGIDRLTFQRMKNRPGKALTGALLIGAAFGVAKKTLQYLNTSGKNQLHPLSPSFSSQKTIESLAKTALWGSAAFLVFNF